MRLRRRETVTFEKSAAVRLMEVNFLRLHVQALLSWEGKWMVSDIASKTLRVGQDTISLKIGNSRIFF